MNNKTEFQFKSNLISRVRNFSMSPNEKNSIMPLFEAITNSLQAISEKYREEWIKKGNINVYIYLDEKEEYPADIEIEDNGVGFDDVNFDSFLTFDSVHKEMIGGKGIGRFSWLKAFESVHITSIFYQNNKKYRREFDFVLEEIPVKNHFLIEEDSAIPEKTTIRLKGMKSVYRTRFPNKMDAVIRKILVHFLPILVAGSPSINIISENQDSSDIKTLFSDNSYNILEEDVLIEEYGTFHLRNIFLDRSCLDGRQKRHTFFLSANNRIVDEHKLSDQLGMPNSCEYNEKSVFYIGIITGELLDKSVFGERNSFDLSDDVKDKILRYFINHIKENYLKEQIQNVIAEKTFKLKHILKRTPRFNYLVSDVNEYAQNKLSLAAQSDEDIVKELSIRDYRETSNTEKEIQKFLDNGYSEDEFDENFSKTLKKINEQNKSNLAEYVLKRKVILDILKSRLAYKDIEKQTKFKEDAIHKIICPMQITSNDISIKDHNLWIINDTLSFYKFIASDKRIKTFLKNSQSDDRPDLVLFNGCVSFSNQCGPTVIIEFKRPERNDYTDDKNPIQQVLDYIKEFRGKQVHTAEGELVADIDDNTSFFCYIICDINDKLKEILKDRNLHIPLIGRRGFFGYNIEHKAYIEIIDFAEMIKEANNRNEFFFKELGI